MKTVNIKGREYVMVNERVLHFREHYPTWSLTTEIHTLTEKGVIIKASVIDENGNVRATGFAHETHGSSQINKTSFIENCETSAWGRALANLGIGIDASVASAQEVATAISQQSYKDVVK